jgi:chromosome segregation ATPase
MYQLQKQENKLTVGFRCSPQTKIRLMEEANQNGVSLSEYLESLIARIESSSHTKSQNNNTTSEIQYKINALSNRVAQYETPLLKSLFQQAKANPSNSHIGDLPDLVNALVQSYQNNLK